MKAAKNRTRIIQILFMAALFLLVMGIGLDVYAASTEPVTIRIPVVQSFSSQDKPVTDSIEQYTYEFTPLEKNNPMPSETVGGKYEITIIGTQTVEIGDLIYVHAGIYNYQLNVVKSSHSSDFRCDITGYTITVCVRNEGNGLLGKPEVITKNSNGKKSDILAYHYVSSSRSGDNLPIGIPQTGDNSNTRSWIVIMSVSAFSCLLILVYRKRKPEEKRQQEQST